MGIFGKFKNALKKTKDSFSQKLTELFAKDKIGEDFYEELEEILISSDVSVTTAMDVVDNIRDRAIKEKCKDKEYVINLLKEELLSVLTSCDEFELDTPAVVMVVGVNGVGKTTTIGKLASMLTKQGKSVMIAAADTFRAAAVDQISVWADRAKVKIVKSFEGADPSSVVFDAITSAKARKVDVLIIDTAGRLHVKANLMEELKKMNRIIDREYPDANVYRLIALDATTGQNAYNQVEVFNDAVGLDGVILTKLDGTAKGGFVISLAGELSIPVAYVGTGEKIDDIEEFDAQDFIEDIL